MKGNNFTYIFQNDLPKCEYMPIIDAASYRSQHAPHVYLFLPLL